jgi:hypothetical protein
MDFKLGLVGGYSNCSEKERSMPGPNHRAARAAQTLQETEMPMHLAR